MERKRILVLVKTYPTPADTYIETVCVAGLSESGDWIRIYPIRFRMLEREQQFKKFDWIEILVEKRPTNKDRRPESFRCDISSVKIIGRVETGGPHWPTRRELCLKKVYTSIESLYNDSRFDKECVSLAVFKPTKILDFTIEPHDTAKIDDKKHLIQVRLHHQPDLIPDDIPYYWEMAKSIPFRFGYRFQDSNDRIVNLMIEDWELGALFFKYSNDYDLAQEKVRQKYFDDFVKTKDLYFFLGTRLEHHMRNLPNYFSIIGIFPPKPIPNTEQLPLF